MRDRAHTRIGLLDHLGHGNLGDDATLDAVMSNITRRSSGAEIIGLSLNPVDTQKRHGIPCYAIRRDSKLPPGTYKSHVNGVGTKEKLKALFSHCQPILAIARAMNAILIRIPSLVLHELFFLIESFRIMRSLNALIICGGGQLLDSWGGPWKFPYTLFKWVLLAKLARKQIYFINVGSGPIDHALSKRFIKDALRLSDYASFRDPDSLQLVNSIGFTRKSEVVTDSVYSLDMDGLRGGQGNSTVGFSPMAYCDPRVYWDKNQAVYDCYIRKLALFASWIMGNNRRLMLFSTEIQFDSAAIDDVATAVQRTTYGTSAHSVIRKHVTTIQDLLSIMSSMDYIVTSRYHGVVFAHLMNIPVLAISHHPKVATLMREVGLSEYCIDIRRFDVDALITKFSHLVDNRDKVKETIASHTACYKARLSTQFDHLFGYQAVTSYREIW